MGLVLGQACCLRQVHRILGGRLPHSEKWAEQGLIRIQDLWFLYSHAVSGCIKLSSVQGFPNFPTKVSLSSRKNDTLGRWSKENIKKLSNCRFILRFLGFLGHPLCSGTTRYSEESSSSRSRLLQGKTPEGVERAGVLESARPGFENQL